MDDETITIINCSHQFDDSTSDTDILKYDESTKSKAPPILTTMLLESRHKIWKQHIQKHNLEKYPQEETLFNTSKIKIAVDMEIEDAGATGHCFLPVTPVTDI